MALLKIAECPKKSRQIQIRYAIDSAEMQTCCWQSKFQTDEKIEA
jgi:hypothetical protein